MTADTSSGYNSYRRSCLMFRAIMRTPGLFLLCLASIPVQSSGLSQTDSLALKSQRAKQLMAEGNFAQAIPLRSEEHTSELQSQSNLVCRLLLEKKKKTT